ncbi:motility associated factor glycosyltransferase family protein [Jeotgalibacillus aurantiacus]|uniref:motility associated factor glycosyltransferase family protein n=1 Tax=Jeotgalibacillus aurantiacus TaxID=2763266 RepID=UPI001D0BC747|nr:6-hydroxymethylpterin diphosphokinase MptE-like protein [Jeotgalibacillus aurantiacus]
MMHNIFLNPETDVEVRFENCRRAEQLTVKLNDFYVHSKYDPLREAQLYVKNHFKRKHFNILFGVGLGYKVEEILNSMTDDTFLLIIEPDETVFNKLKEHINLKLIIDNPDKCILFVGQDIKEVKKLIQQHASKFLHQLNFMEHQAYCEVFKEYYTQIIDVIKEQLYSALVNKNTTNFFSEYWQKNFFLNLASSKHSIPINNLLNCFEFPIIIVSGGPSLNKHLSRLKEIQHTVFIICAGSTLNSLLTNGIKPDILVNIDGAPINYEHYKDVNFDDIPLFYPLILNHKVLEHHKGMKVIFDLYGNTSEIINELFECEVTKIMGGGSVANFSLDIAMKLTSGPVCLIGQDLAYTAEKSHADGNRLSKKIEPQQKKLIPVKGYYGGEVKTDYPFLSMKNQFEHYLSIFNPNSRVFNATEGGVYIEGAKNISFEDFLNNYPEQFKKPNLKAYLDQIDKIGYQEDTFNKLVKREKYNVNRIKELAEEALTHLKQTITNQEDWTKSELKKLEEIDEKLKELLKNDLMYYLFQPVVERVLRTIQNFDDNKNREEDLKKLSVELYERIAHSSEKALTWIDEIS